MILQYIADVMRGETLVDLRVQENKGTVAFVVVNDETRKAEIHFAVDGELYKIPLNEFEEALQKAKSMLLLDD